MKKPTLGHIDCPYCAGVQTMRITHDRNNKPFGHCDDCNGQLRVGGNTFREKKFIERYPFAAAKAPEIPVTVTEPEKPVEPVSADKTNQIVSEAIKAPPAKPRSTFAAALNLLGGV
ncbi:hypothetical protein [Oxalicibacterium faecigallinarum]|uniref:Uncharacterized protein n=1 Tax=Oxalicibacterium faecigallinarum TaxID=573741 RepID=A0A8J3AN90_9BURK|nr:hypothetical protein [Oxalicibacterium faecigallinarum]GGI16913.1 hypothetical protein GCM10008066_06340 [Oxalicibacterium faecigallinarum]